MTEVPIPIPGQPIDVNEPLAKLPALQAARRPMAVLPTSMTQVANLAMSIHRSGLAPRNFNTPDKITYAILAGAELGLPPLQALKSIVLINGVASLYGDGLLGVVRASGLMQSIKEEMESDEKGYPLKATCTVRRRDEDYDVVRSFSRQDAEIAGLMRKEGPWKQFPGRMLMFRARNYALRDTFSDILSGLGRPYAVLDDATVLGDSMAIDVAYDQTTGEISEPRRSDAATDDKTKS